MHQENSHVGTQVLSPFWQTYSDDWAAKSLQERFERSHLGIGHGSGHAKAALRDAEGAIAAKQEVADLVGVSVILQGVHDHPAGGSRAKQTLRHLDPGLGQHVRHELIDLEGIAPLENCDVAGVHMASAGRGQDYFEREIEDRLVEQRVASDELRVVLFCPENHVDLHVVDLLGADKARFGISNSACVVSLHVPVHQVWRGDSYDL
jgi:hypothetical protein